MEAPSLFPGIEPCELLVFCDVGYQLSPVAGNEQPLDRIYGDAELKSLSVLNLLEEPTVLEAFPGRGLPSGRLDKVGHVWLCWGDDIESYSVGRLINAPENPIWVGVVLAGREGRFYSRMHSPRVRQQFSRLSASWIDC